MRSLFLKIFLWFFAAQILIAGVLALFTAATQRSYDEQLQSALGQSLEERARAAAITYEVGGIGALRQAWRQAPPRDNNANGANNANGDNGDNHPPPNGDFGPPDDHPPSPPPDDSPDDSPDAPPNQSPGSPPDAEFGPQQRDGSALYLLRAVKAAKQGEITKLTPVLLVGRPLPDLAVSLLTRAQSEVEPTQRLVNMTFLARGVQTRRGARYVAVAGLRSGRHQRFFDGFLQFGPGPGGPFRLVLVALTMGAVCFALARYLTDPAIKLSRATRQFAAGDLEARVGPHGRRRDELADLGRDFDLMAERIQSLLVSERRLLGDISHELRSPLTRLKLALDLAAQTADSPTRDYLHRIGVEAEELNALIGQLLTLTRLESTSAVSSQKYPVDLGEIVAHVCHNADFEAQARGGRVEITQNAECELEGQGELLQSALENVVRNAILHSPAAPRVEVSLQCEAKIALVRVRDFGPGVPAEALPLLFRPFYRVAEARDRQSGGTGLGLSITRRAVEFHGGSVEAFNADGGGLLVEIRLPV